MIGDKYDFIDAKRCAKDLQKYFLKERKRKKIVK